MASPIPIPAATPRAAVPTPGTAPSPVNITVVPSFPPAVVNVRAPAADHVGPALTILATVLGTLAVQAVSRRWRQRDDRAQAVLEAQLSREAERLRAGDEAARDLHLLLDSMRASQPPLRQPNGHFDEGYLEQQRMAAVRLSSVVRDKELQRRLARSFELMNWADGSVPWRASSSRAVTEAAMTQMESDVRAYLGGDELGEPASQWAQLDEDLSDYHEMLGETYEQELAEQEADTLARRVERERQQEEQRLAQSRTEDQPPF